jgi:hypothetical protein
MLIAVRTNDGTFLYANGHSRSSYNVFSYRELFDGDDTKAIEFIREWNEGEAVPTHVRPLEYGAIVIDFPTKQIFNDSYYDTNINLMTHLSGGSFIDELIAMERTRTASDEELARPVYDHEGNLWDGIGDKPDEGGYREGEYKDAFFIDYSPWKVRCFPETPGGRVAFFKAVESCGFPVRRDLWEKRSGETEETEMKRARESADILKVIPRLRRSGVGSGPLWKVDETGAYTANIILKFDPDDGDTEYVLVPITLPGTSEIRPICRIVGAWHSDETFYTDGSTTYSDRDDDDPDGRLLPFSRVVGPDERLDLFACLLLGAGGGEDSVLDSLDWFYDDGKHAPEIACAGLASVDLEDVLLREEAETPADEIERARAEAERRLRQCWAVYEGALVKCSRAPFWGVSCDNDNSERIEVGPSVYGGNGSGTIHGFFGVDRREEAFAYAHRLLELGCGSSLEVAGTIEMITPGVQRETMNHGDEIREMAEAFVTEVFGTLRKGKGVVDPSVEPQLQEISELLNKHRTEWEGVDREWPLDAEWKAVWSPLSDALGEVTPEKLASLEKPRRSWQDPARLWRLKAALDMVTFPERLAALAAERQ